MLVGCSGSATTILDGRIMRLNDDHGGGGVVEVLSDENEGEVTTGLRMADGVTTVVRTDQTLRQAATIGGWGSFTMVVVFPHNIFGI
jgi:hypothetical protein